MPFTDTTPDMGTDGTTTIIIGILKNGLIYTQEPFSAPVIITIHSMNLGGKLDVTPILSKDISVVIQGPYVLKITPLLTKSIHEQFPDSVIIVST